MLPWVLGPLPGAPAGPTEGLPEPPEVPPELPGGTGVADKEELGLEGISQYPHLQMQILIVTLMWSQLMPDDKPNGFES